MNRRDFLKLVAGAVAGLFVGRVTKVEAKAESWPISDSPWTHVLPDKKEEAFIPSLPGCELTPGPVPDVNTYGWLRLIQNPSWGSDPIIELDARAEEGIRVDGVGTETVPWAGRPRHPLVLEDVVGTWENAIYLPTYAKPEPLKTDPVVSWSFPEARADVPVSINERHKFARSEPLDAKPRVWYGTTISPPFSAAPIAINEGYRLVKSVEGWTIIFWRDDVPYSIVMVKGAAIPRFCRDSDDLAWTNWGPEQDGWLAEKKGFASWAMEERYWVVDSDFKGRYDGYIFLPHMVSLLGTWPNDQLWDMHLFWRGDWFWVQYERRKPGLEA